MYKYTPNVCDMTCGSGGTAERGARNRERELLLHFVVYMMLYCLFVLWNYGAWVRVGQARVRASARLEVPARSTVLPMV